MTTIIYSHKQKQIAWESRRSRCDGMIVTDNDEKMVEVDGVKFWLAGIVADSEMLIDAYFGAELKLIPECSALVYDDGKLYRVGVNEHMVLWKEPVEHDDGFGSGFQFALAALDHGKTAKEAVEYAITRDSCSGGKIQTFDIE